MTTFQVSIGGREHTVTIDDEGTFGVDGVSLNLTISNPNPNTYIVSDGGASVRLLYDGQGQLLLNGRQHDVVVHSERDLLLRKYAATGQQGVVRSEVRAPMPALVVGIEVKVGETVEEGQGLIVLEAMKMENELRSHRAGVVKEIRAAKGKTVEKNDLLIVLE
jgi:acetyl/propionyl-CoA carboxylase alpha subunit